MRRMRDLSFIHYIVFAIPALAAVFGIQYLVRNGGGPKATPPGARKVASAPEKDRDPRSLRGMGADEWEEDIKEAKDDERESHDRREGAASPKKQPKVAKDDHEREDRHAVAEHEAESAHRVAPAARGKGEHAKAAPGKRDKHEKEWDSPSTAAAGVDRVVASTGGDCQPIEYRGSGPDSTKVTKAEWGVVMDQFHDAKENLLGWLKKHRSEFPAATASLMEKQVRNLKIQRPPAAEEPDLAWRGVGVYTFNSENEALLKMGGGFVKLAARHPARAKFELVRLVAQSWAPCELQRVSGAPVWTPLLKCLNVGEAQGCAVGSYSESGWAVSSTLAAAVSAPGCQLPVFRNPELAKCLNKIPLQATADAAPARNVQIAEAR